jgi:hypothetical protein
VNYHIGNIKFRDIIVEEKPKYLDAQCKKIEKGHICAKVVAQVRDATPPGHFLKRDDKTGIWVEVGDEKARKKAGQALREDATEFRASGILNSSARSCLGSSTASNNRGSQLLIQTRNASLSLIFTSHVADNVPSTFSGKAPLPWHHLVQKSSSPLIPLTVAKPAAGRMQRALSDDSVPIMKDSVQSFCCSFTAEGSFLRASLTSSSDFDSVNMHGILLQVRNADIMRKCL